MNIALLNRLRAAAGGHVPLGALRTEFAEAGNDLDDLEAFGYHLERHPYLGVAYRGPAQRLAPDQIEWQLGTRRIGRRIAVWSRVGSTNDLATQAAQSRANDGLVILAEEQTQGRGRRGRSWSAPRGKALLLSVLIFPPPTLDEPGWLTALGAVAVAEVVESLAGRPAGIKWPNDVRIGGKKLAGVLVERSAGAVVGIGLNVNTALDDFPDTIRETATSLQAALGQPLDRSEIARALIQRLDALYDEGLESGPTPLEAAWRRRLEWLGRPVRLETAAGTVQGRLADASLAGGLVITQDSASSRRLPAREVLSLALDESSVVG